METNAVKPKVSKNDYKAAGIGALVGGTVAGGALEIRTANLAKRFTEALLNPDISAVDTFVSKNNKVVARALQSKEGYFGKINKLLGPVGFKYKEEAVEEATRKTVEGYSQIAVSKTAGKFTGDRLVQETIKARNKLISKDIAQSIKSTSKTKSALIIAGAVILSAITGVVVKEVKENSKSKAYVNELALAEKADLKTHQG